MLWDLRRDHLTACRPRGYVGSKQGEPAPVVVRSFFLASDPLGGCAGGLTARPKPAKLISQPQTTLCNSLSQSAASIARPHLLLNRAGLSGITRRTTAGR
jgi:hypothetical protein